MIDVTQPVIRSLTRRDVGLDYALAVSAQSAGDWYHQAAADYGAWTPVQDCLLGLVSPGDTILDVGANIGTVTIPLAAKGANVIAYEALAQNAFFLEAAVDANGFGNRVTIRNVAAWDKSTKLSFTGASAWGHVSSDGQSSCEAVAIDNDLPPDVPVKAIKIDVEGSELHVLCGMRKLIERNSPHIVFEINSLQLGRIGSSAAAIFEFMKQYDYGLYRIHGKRRLLRTGEIPQECDVADFLATRCPPWLLRWRARFRVGTIRNRHLIKRILEYGEDEWLHHLHVLAVADHLPRGVVNEPRVARRIAAWHARYHKHPLLGIIARGMFHEPEPMAGTK